MEYNYTSGKNPFSAPQGNQWINTLFEKLQTISDIEKTHGASCLNRRYSEEEVKQCASEDENQSKSFSSLKVPELKHNHLISPPPSPPEGNSLCSVFLKKGIKINC